MEYKKKLEKDKTIKKWTKKHGIVIQYVTEAGNVRGYHPDFLIEKVDGQKELHEVKGGQFWTTRILNENMNQHKIGVNVEV